MKIVFIGLTISSSWGNGHAITYRALLEGLADLGHEVYFLEHDKPYYAKERDFSSGQPYTLLFYDSLDQLRSEFYQLVRDCDLLVIGSYVFQGVEVINWGLKTNLNCCAFYDIDTPVTLEKLGQGDYEYLLPEQVAAFDFYLSFSGGRALDILHEKYDAKKALPLYCSVNPSIYRPLNLPKQWMLGYLGTYSIDRQENLNLLLIQTARLLSDHSFVIAGPGFPSKESWPKNIQSIEHLSPSQHLNFYNTQMATINVTRKAMRDLGHSPSIRLFEAAACGVPVISDFWEGISDFFRLDEEILVCNSTLEVAQLLERLSEDEFEKIGQAARERVLKSHTAVHRAVQLMDYVIGVEQAS